jgi:hypothetical protein
VEAADAGERVGEDLGDHGRDRGVDHRGGARGLSEGGGVGDGEAQRGVGAAAGEGRVGGGELAQFDLAAAEREREPVVFGALIEARHTEAVQQIEQLLGALFGGEADRGDVERAGQRLAQRDRPLEAAVEVLRDIHAAGLGEGGLDVGGHLRGAVTRGEGQRVHEGLEGRAGLTTRARHVDLPGDRDVVKVRAADVGQDLAAGVVDDDHRRVAAPALGDAGEVRARQALDRALQAEVERRDRGCPRGQLILGQQRLDQVRGVEGARQRAEDDRLVLRPPELLRAQVTRLVQGDQQRALTQRDPLGMIVGVEEGRRARQHREVGGLGPAEVLAGDAEVGASGRLGADQAVAVGQAVQVLAEDLRLAQRLLEVLRAGGLAELLEQAAEVRAAAAVEQLDQLLGDRARAGDHAAVTDVLRRGPGDRPPVDAAVREELRVLAGQRRLHQARTDRLELERLTAHAGVAGQLAQQPALPVEHAVPGVPAVGEAVGRVADLRPHQRPGPAGQGAGRDCPEGQPVHPPSEATRTGRSGLGHRRVNAPPRRFTSSPSPSRSSCSRGCHRRT